MLKQALSRTQQGMKPSAVARPAGDGGAQRRQPQQEQKQKQQQAPPALQEQERQRGPSVPQEQVQEKLQGPPYLKNSDFPTTTTTTKNPTRDSKACDK
ncbi:hypothetical protein Pcinc_014310 [Petrolisthes cinctipes]|uniref:Uncharacterized protein n=1 Tax=Petrolisthes cinctipes TaxID=88211 RepID=A0AAE1KRH5_PETCI|nr:hypothetical protein Pcinc_014310 [Petrolisthes cinctipes]